MAESKTVIYGAILANVAIAITKFIVAGAASMLIGLLLAGVAVLLIRESRGLLVGEGVNAETAKAI